MEDRASTITSPIENDQCAIIKIEDLTIMHRPYDKDSDPVGYAMTSAIDGSCFPGA